MLVRLEKKSYIRAAHKQLGNICKSELPEKETRRIGFPSGGLRDCQIRTNGKYWFWQGKHEPEDKVARHLNWFGLIQDGKPSLDITFEANAYFEGPSWSIAGFFAKEPESGNLYLMHSGKIGGGKKGQSKENFLAWLGADMEDVISSDHRIQKANVVMPLFGRHAMASAFKYVDEVASFKSALRDGSFKKIIRQSDIDGVKSYLAESSGRRRGKRTSEIDYISRHGLVVDALKNWREEEGLPKNCMLTNTVFRDLALEKKDNLLELYEVKTSSGRQHVYTAIGQLMVHDGGSASEKYIVLPDEGDLPPDLIQTLTRLNIELIRYRFRGSKIEFGGL